MRVFVIVVCLFGLSVLIGCGEPEILYSEPVSDQNPQAVASVRGPAHVCLRIGDGFSEEEQYKILAAVAQENLIAPVQFDFAPETANAPRPGSWTLLKRGGSAQVVQQFAQGGGAIALDAGRLTPGDLRKAIAEAGSIPGNDDLRCHGAGATGSTDHVAEPEHDGGPGRQL